MPLWSLRAVLGSRCDGLEVLDEAASSYDGGGPFGSMMFALARFLGINVVRCSFANVKYVICERRRGNQGSGHDVKA